MSQLLIAAGGTGGHVFPGIAVANCALSQGHEVSWIGRNESKEQEWVSNAGIQFYGIQANALRGKGLMAKLKMPFELVSSVLAARKLIQVIKPDAILGMGGYVAAPVGLAAKLCRVPLYIHEQNAVAGMTNKWLSKVAKKTLSAFSDNGIADAQLVGNPVREDIQPVDYAARASQSVVTIAVIGGSQGSKFLNQELPSLLATVAQQARIQVIHQSGEPLYQRTQEAYAHAVKDVEGDIFENVTVQPFIQDMGALYAGADVVVARAGALTVAEVAKAGLPAIFVPYPYAVDDHQTRNAQALVEAGAAIIVQEKDYDPNTLTATLIDLVQDFAQRNTMAAAARGVFPNNSAEAIVKICLGHRGVQDV